MNKFYENIFFMCFQDSDCSKLSKTVQNFEYKILSARFISCVTSIALHKKWNFPLKISSVNVTKSAAFCGFGHIYGRNP